MQTGTDTRASASGTIVAAQEGRFKLACTDGRYKFFVLAHGAAQQPQDLAPLVDSGMVVVDYSELPGRIAGLAHRIDRAPDR
ncbi:MAG TPA: hypothetical protein PK177_14845 [Burkholderiaceae bacterium]|nr:hypothetical protein [Burkholderiaceae bacterium]